MSDAPQAEKRESPTPEQLAQREKFEGLYCDWHVARAALFDPNQPEDDRTSNARSRRADEAERALLTTPAPKSRTANATL